MTDFKTAWKQQKHTYTDPVMAQFWQLMRDGEYEQALALTKGTPQQTTRPSQIATELKNSLHDQQIVLDRMVRLAPEGLKAIDDFAACLRSLHKPTYH